MTLTLPFRLAVLPLHRVDTAESRQVPLGAHPPGSPYHDRHDRVQGAPRAAAGVVRRPGRRADVPVGVHAQGVPSAGEDGHPDVGHATVRHRVHPVERCDCGTCLFLETVAPAHFLTCPFLETVAHAYFLRLWHMPSLEIVAHAYFLRLWHMPVFEIVARAYFLRCVG